MIFKILIKYLKGEFSMNFLFLILKLMKYGYVILVFLKCIFLVDLMVYMDIKVNLGLEI